VSRLLILLLLAASFVVTPVVAGEIFKCRDAMGRVAFQDHPCHRADKEERLILAPSHAPDTTAGTTAGTEPPLATPIQPEKRQADSKSFAWKLSKGKRQGYLMGSIHFGKASMYPLPLTLLNAFKGSDALVVEANVVDADASTMAHTMMSAGVYSDGTTLKKVLGDDLWGELGVTSAALGIPVSMLEGMKPWFASMTLTAMVLKGIGLDESLGIDRHFLDMAKAQHKPIRELESVQQQLALLSGLPQKIQIAMLKQTLKDVAVADAYFDRMLKAWQSGDVLALNRLFVDEGLKSDELNRVMNTDRNITMAKKVDEMLIKGCHCFVVVGAGHLGGEAGMIKLLQAKGYEVEQL
jgi:uncharacterized protein YbaP (TraB family)